MKNKSKCGVKAKCNLSFIITIYSISYVGREKRY